MTGRKAKPVDLIIMDGKGHRTKEEIRVRKEREVRPDSDQVICPEWLCDDAKKEWYRLESELRKLNLLTNIDYNQLAIYCDSYIKYVQATKDINEKGLVITTTNKSGATNTIANPSIRVATKYADLIKKYCAEFGFTPTSRAKLAIPRDNETNKAKERLKGLI